MNRTGRHHAGTISSHFALNINTSTYTTKSAHLTNKEARLSYLLGCHNGTWEVFKHLSSIRIIHKGQILQRDCSVLGPAFGWKNVSTVTSFGLELCVSQYSLDRNHRCLGTGQMETNRRKPLVQLYHKAKYKATQSWKLAQVKDTKTLKCFGEGLTKNNGRYFREFQTRNFAHISESQTSGNSVFKNFSYLGL